MFPNYFDGITVLTIAYLAEDSENKLAKKNIRNDKSTTPTLASGHSAQRFALCVL